MMLSQETPATSPSAHRRRDWAKLVLDDEKQPADADWRSDHRANAVDDGAVTVDNALRSQCDRPHRTSAPPSATHWFGTDEVGRDLFSRVLVGSQQSIVAGLVVVGIAGGIGSLLGCLSGVMGGRADAIIMRVMDVMLSIPSLVLTMALAAALGPSLFNAMLAIAIVRIPFYVRTARGQTWSSASLPTYRLPVRTARPAGI